MQPKENDDSLLEEIRNIPGNKANIDRLINQLKRRAGVVPFVGAGLSIPFGFPGWSVFLTNQAERLKGTKRKQQIFCYIEYGKYEEAAEVLSTTPGYNFNKAIRETFGSSKLAGKELGEAVSILPQLEPGPVVTTNFDGVLKKVFEQNGQQFEEVVWGGRSLEVRKLLYEGQRFLLKLHGDAEDSTDRVLTKSEYQMQYGSEDASHVNLSLPLPQLLQAILKYRPLLFLGCSLNQDRTVQVLEQVSQKFRYVRPYAIVEVPETAQDFRQRADFLSGHNIHPIWYPKGKHSCIKLLLEYLVKKSAYTVFQFFQTIEDPVLSSTLRKPNAESSSYLSSSLQALLEQVGADTTYDFVEIDLGEGKEWVTSRLFIFAIILERLLNLQCFVFLETRNGAPTQFIGIASPDEVRWRLACKYPWLEEAFAKAYCSQMPSIKRFFGYRQPYPDTVFVPPIPDFESLIKLFQQIE